MMKDESGGFCTLCALLDGRGTNYVGQFWGVSGLGIAAIWGCLVDLLSQVRIQKGPRTSTSDSLVTPPPALHPGFIAILTATSRSTLLNQRAGTLDLWLQRPHP